MVKFWFQSTPSVKRVTARQFQTRKKFYISIHTLCEEGDIKMGALFANSKYFNPHPLWRGWQFWASGIKMNLTFQSTPSVKRVTFISRKSIGDFYISIHTLCEEGDRRAYLKERGFTISIHTLCEEGDETLIVWFARKLLFQSTPSVKRVTFGDYVYYCYYSISIHTLCEEGDSIVGARSASTPPISIHTLCEEGDYHHDKNLSR